MPTPTVKMAKLELRKWSAPIRFDIPEQARWAVALVLPTRVVEDRVEADPLDRHAGLTSPCNLMANHPQPSRTRVALDTDLRNE